MRRHQWISLTVLSSSALSCGDPSTDSVDPTVLEPDEIAEPAEANEMAVTGNEGTSGNNPEEANQATDSNGERLPLEELILNVDPRFSVNDPHAVAEAREAVVETCMIEAGFRYRAVDVRAINEHLRQNFEHPDWIDADTDYGLGINFLVPTVIQDPPGSDPNVDTVAALTEEEKELWSRQRGDCRILATWRVPASVVDLSPLREELNVLQERIHADSRIVAAQNAWRACMAAEGYKFDDHEDLLKSLESSYQPLWDRFLDEGRDYDVLSTSLRSDVDVYLDQERAIAEADATCRQELDQTIHAVTAERQLRFIEDNEDQLALIRQESEQLLLDSESVEFANIEHFLPSPDRTAIVTDPLGRVMRLNRDELMNSDGPPTTAP